MRFDLGRSWMKAEQEESRARIGVVGLGAVGKAFAHAMSWFHDVVGYDIKGSYQWDPILTTSTVFVCVSTPESAGGRLDCGNVEAVLRRLSLGKYPGIVVIRSTLGVGFMDGATERHPTLRLVYSPEFLREKSRFQWSANPDRIVLSGSPTDIEQVRRLFFWVENATTLAMSYKEAELGKLAHNAFIATKVSFTNEIQGICARYGANPDNVMSVVTSDRRVVSREHLRPGLGPYSGSCVPKDTRELMNAGGETPLLHAVEQVNRGEGAKPASSRARPSLEARHASEPVMPSS